MLWWGISVFLVYFFILKKIDMIKYFGEVVGCYWGNFLLYRKKYNVNFFMV